jgi:ABC-type multidrug transport system ATPase subunit
VSADAIVATGLVKRYRAWGVGPARAPVLAGLDLRVPTGSVTGLLGPNGSGKSTAVKILLGLVRATEGTATVLSLDAARDSLAIRQRTSFVPERRDVLPWMRVRDFVSHTAALCPTWDAARATALSRRWELPGDARLGELSTGMRSRLMLLVALVRRPALMILDEATTGLDPAVADEALGELAASAADGTTILHVTHRLDEVERVCDRVVVMQSGRALLAGDLEDMRASWCVIDVSGHPAPERMATWEEVATVTPVGDIVRLIVRADRDSVVARLLMIGAEVVSVRALTLREMYFHLTDAGGADASPDHLA